MRTCRNCGASFTAATNHRKLCTGCSRDRRRNLATCLGCGREWLRGGTRFDRCHDCRRADRAEFKERRSVAQCEVCQRGMPARAGKRYCSKECLDWWSGGYRVRTTKACAFCGEEIRAKGHQRFCSDDCRAADGSMLTLSDRCQLKWRPCVECSREFVAVFCRKRCTRCRDEVAHRREKERQDRRRARRLGGDKDITVEAVCERDGWICHLCEGPIPRQKSTGWANDPTIDHLIPVSKGGLHRWNNVKAAHRHCNNMRGNADLAVPLDEWELFGVVA